MAEQTLKEMTELEKVLRDLNQLGDRLDKNLSDIKGALNRAVYYQEPMVAKEESMVGKSSPPGDDMVWKLNNTIVNLRRLVDDSETIRNHVNRLA